jgi:hypothetical protein
MEVAQDSEDLYIVKERKTDKSNSKNLIRILDDLSIARSFGSKLPILSFYA